MRQRVARVIAAIGIIALATAGTARAGDLKLSIQNGRVTLVAQDVPLRQILNEWSRVGKTEIVNAEKLIGPSLTLQFIDRPEREVLDVLLRAATGYLVTPRLTVEPGMSQYHRILVMSPSAPAVQNAGGRPGVTSPNGSKLETMPDMQMISDSDEAEESMPPNPYGPAGARPPETMFNYANPLQLQQQLRAAEAAGAVPGAAPPRETPFGAVGSANTPGVVVQPPQQPPPNFRNPYGLPTGVQPGSATVPPGIPPDRSKYQNPGGPPPGV